MKAARPRHLRAVDRRLSLEPAGRDGAAVASTADVLASENARLAAEVRRLRLRVSRLDQRVGELEWENHQLREQRGR